MNKDILNSILDIISIREEKFEMVKLQKYERSAKLRDIEKQLIIKTGKLMRMTINGGLDINDDTSFIENRIEEYLQSNYGVSFNNDCIKVIKRQLRLDDILK